MAANASYQKSVPIERLGPLYWPLYVTLLAIVAVATLYMGVAMASGHEGHHNHASAPHNAQSAQPAPTDDCSTIKNNIAISLTNNGFGQQTIMARTCDVLEITNASDAAAYLAMGTHDSHVAYPGYAEQTVQPNAKVRITLTAAGHFTLHDHNHHDHEVMVHIEQ